MPYIINEETLAIIPEKNKTRVIEGNHNYYFKETPTNLVDITCCINGANLEGRQKGTSYLLGSNYKPPIIINEQLKLILIPTHSVRNLSCSWIMLNNIYNYQKVAKDLVQITFKNNKKVIINCSYSKFDKQVIRATRLESILRGRNSKKYL